MVALGKRLLVESAGTAWLVFIGCGSIVLNVGAIQQAGGVLEAALAFGLALATASYCVGSLSGGHFNPAVTVGFTVAQRFPVRDLLPTLPRRFSARSLPQHYFFMWRAAVPALTCTLPSSRRMVSATILRLTIKCIRRWQSSSCCPSALSWQPS